MLRRLPAATGARTADPPAVLLGGERIAISAARSLGRTGVRVHAFGYPSDIVRHSRHCAEFIDSGSGPDVQARWLAWLEHGPRNAVLLPCSDDGVELLARKRAALSALGYAPVEANDEVALAMLSKARTYELADRMGIARPRTLPATEAAIERAGRELGFPCALKPVASHRFGRRFGLSQKAFVVADESELRKAHELTRGVGLEMLVTEIVAGGDERFHTYYTYLDDTGRPLFELTKQKLRQHPPRFGLTCYAVTDWEPEVAATGLRFLQGIGLRGVASIEFKRDARDGRLRLIECNHRLSASTEFIRICGIDQPLFAYRRALGHPVPVIDGYRQGVRMWHPIEDARAFLVLRREGELSFAAWLRSLAHRQRFPLLSLEDPRPSLVSNASQARQLARRLGSQSRSSGPAENLTVLD